MVPLLDAIFALSLMPCSSILLRLRLASSCRLAVRCVAQEAEKRVSAQEKRASAQEKRGCAQEAMCSRGHVLISVQGMLSRIHALGALGHRMRDEKESGR